MSHSLTTKLYEGSDSLEVSVDITIKYVNSINKNKIIILKRKTLASNLNDVELLNVFN